MRKPKLQFAKRPSVSVHPALGRRRRWWESTRAYRIEQFPETHGPYIVIAGETVIGHNYSLAAAQRAAAKHWRTT